MAENTYQHVRSRYGDIAKRTGTTIHDKEDDIALAFGYSAQDLHALPDKANLGLSCGNPVAHANIKEVPGTLYAVVDSQRLTLDNCIRGRQLSISEVEAASMSF